MSEGYMAVVIEVGVAEYQNSVLIQKMSADVCAFFEYPTFVMAVNTSLKTSSATGSEKSIPLI